MADFEEMLAWIKRGPGHRYTTALPNPHVPIGGCWSPRESCDVNELPSFPDALVEWASEEFDDAQPVRSLRETLKAAYDAQAAREGNS